MKATNDPSSPHYEQLEVSAPKTLREFINASDRQIESDNEDMQMMHMKKVQREREEWRG